MITRDYEEKDYPTIERWWKAHTGVAPQSEILSEDGLIIDDVCAGWIYTGNSPIAFIGFPVGSPDKSGPQIYEGLEQLHLDLKAIAKARGSTIIFAYTNLSGMLKLYEKLGFIVGDENVTNMIGRV